jgi:hypothetical protein
VVEEMVVVMVALGVVVLLTQAAEVELLGEHFRADLLLVQVAVLE